jgi:hypothetical protein
MKKQYLFLFILFISPLFVSANTTQYGKLNLSVSPNSVKSGEEMQIRFNDILADRYILTAACKDSINVSGKARPDICIEGETIYPTGKDVILVRNFFPMIYSTNNDGFNLTVEAFKGNERVGNDFVYVSIYSKNELIQQDNFNENFRKWGDIKFLNPQEGQSRPEKIRAGTTYTLKWENIVKAEWTGVELYKYETRPSEDYLRNGPTNVSVGRRILDVGPAYMGQESLIVNLPDYLDPGYYYFRFGGKAAGDSSPAIEIIAHNNVVDSAQNQNQTQNQNRWGAMSSDQKISLLESILGSNTEAFKILRVLILLNYL